MSKSRTVLLVLALLAAARLPAQDLEALGDSVVALTLRARAANAALEAATQAARETPDDSLSLSGATLLFKRADLPSRERARLERVFARVARQLDDDLGARGPSLLAETRWQIRVNQTPGVMTRRYVGFQAITHESNATAPVLSFPLDEDYVAEIVLRHVGERLARRSPLLSTWLMSHFAFREPGLAYYYASRDLSLWGTERSRRCVRGVLEDCHVILEPSRREEWYVADDEPRRFLPASNVVRSSVLQYAIERAGATVLDAVLDAPADASPIAVLSAAAGQSPEEFVAGWQEEVAAAGAARVKVRPGMFLSATFWVALCAVVATRRRPR